MVVVLLWFDTLADPFSPMSPLFFASTSGLQLGGMPKALAPWGRPKWTGAVGPCSGPPPGGGALGSGGAVGSCGWIPLGRGPWAPAGRLIQCLDSAPALWFDSLADYVCPLSPHTPRTLLCNCGLILWLS